MEKLAAAVSDVQACRILTKNVPLSLCSQKKNGLQLSIENADDTVNSFVDSYR